MQKPRIKKAQLLAALLLSIIVLCGSARKTFSQTTASSTATQARQNDDAAARRLALVAALERAQAEVVAGRSYVKGLETQVESKQSIIDAQARRQTLSDAAIESLKSEVADAVAVIASQKQSLELGEKEILYLKKELKSVNKKLARSRKLNRYLIVGVILAFLAGAAR